MKPAAKTGLALLTRPTCRKRTTAAPSQPTVRPERHNAAVVGRSPQVAWVIVGVGLRNGDVPRVLAVVPETQVEWSYDLLVAEYPELDVRLVRGDEYVS